MYRTIYSSSQPGQFQSTPSVGRATCDECWNEPMNDISIHALRGEGDEQLGISGVVSDISIHALRGEGDLFALLRFYSKFVISIHALRGEGDLLVRLIM